MHSSTGRTGDARAWLPMLVVAGLLLAGNAQSQTPPPAQVQWSGVERVVAFADVHGAHAELLGLLRETGIVDGQDHWAAGRTHLVSLGDLLDRGADSRKVMDLLQRLQGEAGAAGGRVHVVLGNHEAMNLLGDLRYVDPGEYAAYADMESPAERERARKAWEAAHGGTGAASFEQKFPPGFFGHRAALSPQGRYGQWLLSLPVAVVVNDTLFMHAGPSASLRGMTLPELNLRYRTALTDYLGLLGRLEQSGLLQEGDAFRERPRLARERLAARWRRRAAPSIRDWPVSCSGSRRRTRTCCCRRRDPTGIAALPCATKWPSPMCCCPCSRSSGPPGSWSATPSRAIHGQRRVLMAAWSSSMQA